MQLTRYEAVSCHTLLVLSLHFNDSSNNSFKHPSFRTTQVSRYQKKTFTHSLITCLCSYYSISLLISCIYYSPQHSLCLHN